MSDYFEIAYAAVSDRLCFFTGTGFSKAISNNSAPTWQELLELLCDGLPNAKELKEILFPEGNKKLLSMEETAQIISIELERNGKNIADEIVNIISSLVVDETLIPITSFVNENSFRVITANYDKLLEQLVKKQRVISISPGKPIARISAEVEIYHVHGSIDSPEDMVITADDYFRFINSSSYFSQKLSALLNENTVVILGYSLGDTNLKSIISDYWQTSASSMIQSNIFFVSRSRINQRIKDYYSNSYGMRVIDNVEIDDFFGQLNSELLKAKDCFETSIKSIEKVINENKVFKEEYLALERSFYEIINSINALGYSISDAKLLNLITSIINTKIRLTRQAGAWNQYSQLSAWLVYLGGVMEFRGTNLEKPYLEAVSHSMINMSSKQLLGYSWHSFNNWRDGWAKIKIVNRSLIREYIKEHLPHKNDAMYIVSLC